MRKCRKSKPGQTDWSSRLKIFRRTDYSVGYQRKIFARFEVEVEKIASQFRQNNDGGGSRSKTTAKTQKTQPRRSKTHKQLAACIATKTQIS